MGDKVTKTLSLEKAMQVLALTPEMSFVCRKIFSSTDSFTEDQWREKFAKKGIVSKTKK